MSKGQIATEYLVMMGIVMVLLGSIWAYVNFLSASSSSTLRVEHALLFINRIQQTADLVFAYGPPTKETLYLYLPQGVLDLDIINNSGISITISTPEGNSTYAVACRANITGNLPIEQGYYSIVIESRGDYVNVSH